MHAGRHFDRDDAPSGPGTGTRPGPRGGRGGAARFSGALLKLLAALMVLAGLAVLAWPHIDAALTSWRMGEALARHDDAVAELAEDEPLHRDLLNAVDEYNRALDETGQAGLRDAWSYTEPSFDLTSWGLPDEVYARLRVPAAGIDMPVYLGATEAHLNVGAAHLTQTSLPVRAVEG